MGFWEITVPAPPETSEGLTNFLWEQGALGVVEEAMPPGPPCLRAFFHGSASSATLMAAIRDYQHALVALGFPAPAAAARVEPLLDEAWESAWQEAFPPREVGRHLIVLPPWESPAATRATRLPIVIQPGRAFGTGQHGSTEGCLLLLEQVVAGGAPGRALDIGTGTGILAVAAVRLGVAQVLAVDVDPDAVRAATDNAALNDCTAQIVARPGRAEDLSPPDSFDLVLANLVTASHLALSACYRRLVAARGALVLGGMLAGEEGRVAAALEPMGFVAEGTASVEGWISTLMRREP